MSRYASAGGGSLKASLEFKEMVKALHGAGIEVYHILSGFRIRNTYCLLNILNSSYSGIAGSDALFIYTDHFGCCL